MADDEAVELKPLGRIIAIHGSTVYLDGPSNVRRGDALAVLPEPDVTSDRLRPGRLTVHDVYRSGADINVGESPRSAIPAISVGDWLYIVDERMPDFMDIIGAIREHGLDGAGEALMHAFPEARRRYDAKRPLT